ncbi:extracellular aldonolactonase [Parathielavia appendiculata]|uniref:Extracellular aldonolactonase n=1 Tax=Parathielavia appendiculata TaxID=2587402 RepID=A0AAN6Z6L2_9PEZI|nr:extracellular aldonolactonase [Parathielavia appendiculata]
MRSSYGIAVALSAGLRLTTAAPAPRAESSLLYVTTYPVGQGAGKLITLKQDQTSLQSVAESDSCGPFPSWLTQAGDILYCVNEAWGGANGDLSALKISDDFSLPKLSGGQTVAGPVSTVVYGKGGRGLAVADYAGGGVDTFNITNPAAISLIKSQVYPAPGDNRPEPQNQARPHHAVLDPTGNFLVFPDLGADLLRVLRVNQNTLQYTDTKSYKFARGTGPRHAAFFKSGDKTFLYVVCELANLIQGFRVTYNYDKTLSFSRIYNSTTHGGTSPVPAGTSAAEITLSPDSKFLTVSSRNEKTLQYTLANGTAVPSDPLITFSINAVSGKLTHVQTAPAGGVNPRHFSFNKDGSRVASALQSDGRVIVFERDVASGKIGKAVAEANVPGMPNFVTFKQ